MLISIIKFLSHNGLLSLVGDGGAVVLSIIPSNAVSTYLKKALPQSLLPVDKTRHKRISENFSLDQCDRNSGLNYLFTILSNPDIPYQEKEMITDKILKNYVNLKPTERTYVVICIICRMLYFYKVNIGNFHLIMQKLLEALKEGKISKVIVRAISRKPRKSNIPVDPELKQILR